MSMSCTFYRLTDLQTQSLLESPESVNELLGNVQVPIRKSFLSRFFGKSRNGGQAVPASHQPIPMSETLELNQAWHVLHYLLSGCDAEGPWPSAFIMSGGQEIGPDLGYGPVRLLNTELTRNVAEYLSDQSLKNFEVRYNGPAIEAMNVYWKVSTESHERQHQIQELWDLMLSLRYFLDRTVMLRGSTLIDIY